MNEFIPVKECPECDRFIAIAPGIHNDPGRRYELCTGESYSHRPRPREDQVKLFRENNNLPEIQRVATRHRGLGDTVAAITHATGIDKAAEFVAKKVLGKKDCGCKKRQQQLNDAFPYSQ